MDVIAAWRMTTNIKTASVNFIVYKAKTVFKINVKKIAFRNKEHTAD